MTRVMTREGQTYTEPTQAIFGPKALLINQFSGSGGDALPWYFKRKQIGPLIGERTWGGLVGIGGYPVLLDGVIVRGGDLATSANGVITVANTGTLDGTTHAVTLDAGSQALVTAGTALTLSGAIVNQATLSLHGDGSHGTHERIQTLRCGRPLGTVE